MGGRPPHLRDRPAGRGVCAQDRVRHPKLGAPGLARRPPPRVVVVVGAAGFARQMHAAPGARVGGGQKLVHRPDRGAEVWPARARAWRTRAGADDRMARPGGVPGRRRKAVVGAGRSDGKTTSPPPPPPLARVSQHLPLASRQARESTGVSSKGVASSSCRWCDRGASRQPNVPAQGWPGRGRIQGLVRQAGAGREGGREGMAVACAWRAPAGVGEGQRNGGRLSRGDDAPLEQQAGRAGGDASCRAW